MKLNYKRTILIGFAFMAISAFWQVYDNIIPLILKYNFEIGDTLSGGIMALDNIFALVMLPLFGAWSDKVSTRRGKRMPFITVGTVLAVIFMSMIPMAANMRSLGFFIIALLLSLMAMGIFRSPAVSLMPDVTPKPLRSKGNAIINLMGALGGVSSLVMIMFLVGDGDTPNYQPLFAGVALIMVVALVVLLTRVNENKLVEERIAVEKEYGIDADDDEDEETALSGTAALPKDVKRSLTFLLLSVSFWYMAYNAVTTSFSKYATETWGMEGGGFAGALMVATVAAIISYMPVGIVSSKIGRKKVILFGVVVMAVSFAVAALFKEVNFSINIIFALVGIAWASINVNSYPMVVEMCKGSDIGKFTGMYYTFSMAAQVFTPILSGFFLEHVGYWTLFPYAAIFAAVAFFTMVQVKHGDSCPDIPKKVNA